MKIAVCDDDRAELARIASMLDNYKEERGVPLVHSEFLSSVELASTAVSAGFNIYILDVLMPALNGIELGREIRGFDRASSVIFLTSSPEFALDSYSVKASDYIVKPASKERLFMALDDILERTEQEKEKFIVVKSSLGLRKILLTKLVCVEAYDRKVIYHMYNNEQLECYGRFSSVCDDLMKNPEFMLPHRSFLVNMKFISTIGAADMHLQNGQTIPLAQRRVADIKKHYLAFQMDEVL
ncbi:MAG: LytTR family DNA-binding domain-containing protein [Firmicutes bacterium]|nr:LytTR family DNA-binding domain-containing protein [Bacillota bacterium]